MSTINMPGFTAVESQQWGGRRSQTTPPLLPPNSYCFDIHYVPRCRGLSPFFQCCDYKHERRCIDTYTQCYGTDPVVGTLTP
jgi:hypothetical protein